MLIGVIFERSLFSCVLAAVLTVASNHLTFLTQVTLFFSCVNKSIFILFLKMKFLKISNKRTHLERVWFYLTTTFSLCININFLVNYINTAKTTDSLGFLNILIRTALGLGSSILCRCAEYKCVKKHCSALLLISEVGHAKHKSQVCQGTPDTPSCINQEFRL